ncbi:MAG: hypothetical protein ACR2QF_10190 [Geminicoccaceae bacterium]
MNRTVLAALCLLANVAHAGETTTLQVTATVEPAPVTIQTPDTAEGIEISSEEVAAWCEEFGLLTGECLIDPAEVRR